MGLLAAFAIAWLLVLLGTIVIFEFIIPFQYFGNIFDGILKGVFTLALAVVWLSAMVGMRDYIVKKRILGRKTAAT